MRRGRNYAGMNEIERRVQMLEHRADLTDQRLGRIEDKLDRMSETLARIEGRLSDMPTRSFVLLTVVAIVVAPFLRMPVGP
jgi:hypothetical protein